MKVLSGWRRYRSAYENAGTAACREGMSLSALEARTLPVNAMLQCGSRETELVQMATDQKLGQCTAHLVAPWQRMRCYLGELARKVLLNKELTSCSPVA